MASAALEFAASTVGRLRVSAHTLYIVVTSEQSSRPLRFRGQLFGANARATTGKIQR